MQACHRLWLRAWSSSIAEVADAALPAKEAKEVVRDERVEDVEEEVLADVMRLLCDGFALFLGASCGYFSIFSGYQHTYPLFIHNFRVAVSAESLACCKISPVLLKETPCLVTQTTRLLPPLTLTTTLLT
jgi:hypothetical protein